MTGHHGASYEHPRCATYTTPASVEAEAMYGRRESKMSGGGGRMRAPFDASLMLVIAASLSVPISPGHVAAQWGGTRSEILTTADQQVPGVSRYLEQVREIEREARRARETAREAEERLRTEQLAAEAMATETVPTDATPAVQQRLQALEERTRALRRQDERQAREVAAARARVEAIQACQSENEEIFQNHMRRRARVIHLSLQLLRRDAGWQDAVVRVAGMTLHFGTATSVWSNDTLRNDWDTVSDIFTPAGLATAAMSAIPFAEGETEGGIVTMVVGLATTLASQLIGMLAGEDGAEFQQEVDERIEHISFSRRAFDDARERQAALSELATQTSETYELLEPLISRGEELLEAAENGDGPLDDATLEAIEEVGNELEVRASRVQSQQELLRLWVHQFGVYTDGYISAGEASDDDDAPILSDEVVEQLAELRSGITAAEESLDRVARLQLHDAEVRRAHLSSPPHPRCSGGADDGEAENTDPG